MTRLQRKHLQGITVIILLFSSVWYFQDNPIFARLMFIPAVLYVLLNFKTIHEIESVGPSPKEIVTSNIIVKALTIGLLAAEIGLTYYWILTGSRMGEALESFGILILAIIFPLLPAIILSQFILFRRLGEHKP